MEKFNIYFQMFGAIWVVGWSIFAIKKTDSIVGWNARFGVRVNAKFVSIFFICNLVLGTLGAINIALQALMRSRS